MDNWSALTERNLKKYWKQTSGLLVDITTHSGFKNNLFAVYFTKKRLRLQDIAYFTGYGVYYTVTTFGFVLCIVPFVTLKYTSLFDQFRLKRI